MSYGLDRPRNIEECFALSASEDGAFYLPPEILLAKHTEMNDQDTRFYIMLFSIAMEIGFLDINITRQNCAEIMKINERTVRKRLASLEAKGWITKVGQSTLRLTDPFKKIDMPKAERAFDRLRHNLPPECPEVAPPAEGGSVARRDPISIAHTPNTLVRSQTRPGTGFSDNSDRFR